MEGTAGDAGSVSPAGRHYTHICGSPVPTEATCAGGCHERGDSAPIGTLMSGLQITFPLSGVWPLPLLQAASCGEGEMGGQCSFPLEMPKKNSTPHPWWGGVEGRKARAVANAKASAAPVTVRPPEALLAGDLDHPDGHAGADLHDVHIHFIMADVKAGQRRHQVIPGHQIGHTDDCRNVVVRHR